MLQLRSAGVRFGTRGPERSESKSVILLLLLVLLNTLILWPIDLVQAAQRPSGASSTRSSRAHPPVGAASAVRTGPARALVLEKPNDDDGGVFLPSTAPRGETILYLKADGVPLASLSTAAPTESVLPNYDPGRDAYPGLLVERGGSGPGEADPARYQQWMTSSGGASLTGPVSLVFWSAMRDFARSRRGIVDLFLLDCDSGGSGCSLIAQARKDIFDWSGGWSSWKRYSVEFGDVAYTVPPGRSLSVKLVVDGSSDDDMYFAFDTTNHASRLSDRAASDIVIDCDFSDWSDAEGNEFEVNDQGGPDDWSAPAKLDLTRFAVSSNLVDTFYMLFGFDDVPTRGVTAATLIDTDLDGNVDSALVATLDGANSTVELYSCDDSITQGCAGSVLERTYSQSYYCAGTGPGPWNGDSLLEVVLPFSDLGFAGGPVFLTSLVSYASAVLLTSPKDSILGLSGQDYAAGIYYETTDHTASLIGPVGTDFVIRRDADPSSVRTAAAHATVNQAPFDDLPGSLSDAQTYYYVLEREGGLPVRLSAHANPFQDAPRLGFDDDKALSASVDRSLSTVSLDVPNVPGDGTSIITVTVVPRESNGMLVGAGCDLSLDGIRLSPGSLAGPHQDHLDGTYTFKIVATTGGTGEVEVTVEGIVLDSQPTVTFTSFP